MYIILPQEGTIGEGAHVRHSNGGRYLDIYVIPVRRQRPLNGGAGTRLLLHQLSHLELVTIFTGRWRADKWESGYNRAHESTGETSEIGEMWVRGERSEVLKT